MIRFSSFLPTFFVALLTMCPLPDALGHADKESDTILILNSYDPQFYWTKDELDGIRSVLDRTEKRYRILVENLDADDFPDKKHLENVAADLEFKYRKHNKNIVGIIATDDPAFDFLLQYRERIFPNVPVALSGINKFSSGDSRREEHYSVVVEKVDYKETLEAFFKLMPKVERLYVVHDSSVSALGQARELKTLIRSYGKTFTFVSDFSFQQLARELQALGERDAVVRLAFSRDRLGTVLSFNDAMAFLRENARVPILSFWAGTLGRGVLGGKLLSGKSQGEAAAKLLINQLNGMPFVPVTASENEFVYDYNELKRFGIQLSQLPEGSRVENKPETFFDRYKWLTVGAMAILLTLVLLVAYLARMIIRQRVTERALREATEKAQSANSAKSSFLANISHELRTPLNGILGLTEVFLLERRSSLTTDYATSVQEMGKHLLTLINDLLDIAKVEAGKIEFERLPFAPQRVLEEVVECLSDRAHAKGLRLTLSNLGATTRIVCGDAVRFRQIAFNLIENGIKYTKSGYVRVELKFENAGQEDVRVTLSVHDTGIGMKPEFRDRLFVPFTQAEEGHSREYRGAGLGLSIIKKIIDALGGGIKIESRDGEGTHVEVQLLFGAHETIQLEAALASGASRCAKAESYQSKQQFADIRLLVVEDDPMNQLVIRKMLTSLGVNFDIVSDGSECLVKLSHVNYDLILMDLQMPGVSGLEAARLIRSQNLPVTIVAMSAHGMREHKIEALEAGMNDYLMKPFSLQTLRETLVRNLNSECSAPNEVGMPEVQQREVSLFV